MTACMICGCNDPGYANGIGKFCDNCHWDITHDEEGLIKGYSDPFTMEEWFNRMSIVAGMRGL